MLQKSLLIGILTVAPCILAQKPEFIPSFGSFRSNNPEGQKLILDGEKSCYYFPDSTAYFVSTKNPNYITTAQDGSTIEFNMCGELYPRQQCTNLNGKATIKLANDECYNLGSADHDNGYAIRRQFSDTDLDSEKGGLTVVYSGGDQCGTDNLQYSLDIQVYCSNDDVQKVDYLMQSDCNHIVRVYDKQGCYVFDTNPLIRFLSKYSYVFGAFMIVLGAIIALFGKPLFKPTICLVGMLVSIIILSMFIFSLFFDRNTPQWAAWVTFSISIVVGAIIGLILAKLSKLGVAVLAGWGGFCLGLIIYAAFLYKLDGDKQILYWVFNIGLGVIAGILSIFLFNHAVIFSTAIVGSYAFIRGISFYAGGYPSEFELIQTIKYGGWDGIDKRFYGYMAGFFVASILCIVLQYKLWMREKTHNYKHPYHYKR